MSWILLAAVIIGLPLFAGLMDSPKWGPGGYAFKKIPSKHPDYPGTCTPTWLNRNQVFHRMDGGISGFFKTPKGVRFHGIIIDGVVYCSCLDCTRARHTDQPSEHISST